MLLFTTINSEWSLILLALITIIAFFTACMMFVICITFLIYVILNIFKFIIRLCKYKNLKKLKSYIKFIRKVFDQ